MHLWAFIHVCLCIAVNLIVKRARGLWVAKEMQWMCLYLAKPLIIHTIKTVVHVKGGVIRESLLKCRLYKHMMRIHAHVQQHSYTYIHINMRTHV